MVISEIHNNFKFLIMNKKQQDQLKTRLNNIIKHYSTIVDWLERSHRRWLDNYHKLEDNRIQHGLCYYLTNNSMDSIDNLIIEKAQHDLPMHKVYLFPPPSDFKSKRNIIDIALKPRIKYLKSLQRNWVNK